MSTNLSDEGSQTERWKLAWLELSFDGASEGITEASATTDGQQTSTHHSAASAALGHVIDFDRRMASLWKYAASVGRQASIALDVQLTKSLLEALRTQADQDTESSDKPINTYINVQMKSNKGNVLNKRIRLIQTAQEASDLAERVGGTTDPLEILHTGVLQNQVNAFERMVADIIVAAIAQEPDALPRDYRIPLKDLAGLKNYDQAIEFAILKYVDEHMRDSTKDQLALLRNAANVEVEKFASFIPEFKEVVLRRHAVVHAGGIAVPEYLQKRARLSLPNNHFPVSLGQDLTPDHAYLRHAWCVTYALGWILADRVCRRMAGKSHGPVRGQASPWDHLLFRAGFKCIELGQYRASQLIYEYVTKFKVFEHIERLNMSSTINLAQAYLWDGKRDEALEALGRYEWAALHQNFAVCAYALQGDYSLFVSALSDVSFTSWFPKESFWAWPVFRDMRKNPDYDTVVKEKTGASRPQSSSIHSRKEQGLDVFTMPKPNQLYKAICQFE